MEKYSLEWALQYFQEEWYHQLRYLAEERYNLIEPKCGCRLVKIKNKIVHRKELQRIEMDMRKLIGENK